MRAVLADRMEYAGIDHVQLAMPPGREDDARRFYEDVLGLMETDKPAGLVARGGCWFFSMSGGVHIHLGVDPEFRPATKAHMAFVIRDLAVARCNLLASGVQVIDDDSIAGVHRFYASDPFGNRLEFIAESDRGFTSPDWEAFRDGP